MRKNYLLYAFVIVETSNKYRSKLSFESSEENDLNLNTYLQAMSEKHRTVLAKLELPHFIVFTAINSVHVVGYSSRLHTVLRKMHGTHSNICGLEQCCEYILTTDV